MPYSGGQPARPNVVRRAAGLDWGPAAVASALVTANSTAAIEAMPLGVPALVVGLPNNLSPFVEAGVMAGARLGGRGPALRPCCMIVRCAQRLARRRGLRCGATAWRPTAEAAAGPPTPSLRLTRT